MSQYSRRNEDLISPVSPLTPTFSEAHFDRSTARSPSQFEFPTSAPPRAPAQTPRRQDSFGASRTLQVWELERDSLEITPRPSIDQARGQAEPQASYYCHSSQGDHDASNQTAATPTAVPIQTQQYPPPGPQAHLQRGTWLDDKSPKEGKPPNNATWETHASAIRPAAAGGPQRPGRWARFTKDGWAVEATLLVFSIACLGAIVGILVAVRNRRVSEWTAGITPNALVSLFSTLCKTALLVPVANCISQLKWLHFDPRPRRLADLEVFDSASRGPFGSLLMFFHGSTRGTVAAVGAFLTVVALAADPFSQQVVAVASRQVAAVDGVALFASSTVYDSGAVVRQQQAFRADGRTVDANMYGAIFDGVFSAAPAVTAFECSTSNCLWPGTSAFLGVASSCANVTLETTRSCNQTMGRTDYGCNYTTPGGIRIETRFYRGQAMAHYTVLKAVAAAPNASADPSLLLRYAVWKSPSDGWQSNRYDVTECSLEFAAFYYGNISVVGNRIDVGSSAAFPLRGPSTPDISGAQQQPGQKQPLYGFTPDLSATLSERKGGDGSEGADGWGPGDAQWRRSLLPVNMAVGLGDLVEARRLLQEQVFAANLEEPVPLDTSAERGIARTVLYTTDAAAVSRRLAHSMTERIRRSSPGNGTTRTQPQPQEAASAAVGVGSGGQAAVGIPLEAAAFWEVRWEWFALLPTLVLCSAGLLVATAVLVARQERREARELGAAATTPRWKSSTLALLFSSVHGLDGTRVEEAKRTSSAALQSISREVWVRRWGNNDFVGVQQTGG